MKKLQAIAWSAGVASLLSLNDFFQGQFRGSDSTDASFLAVMVCSRIVSIILFVALYFDQRHDVGNFIASRAKELGRFKLAMVTLLTAASGVATLFAFNKLSDTGTAHELFPLKIGMQALLTFGLDVVLYKTGMKFPDVVAMTLILVGAMLIVET